MTVDITAHGLITTAAAVAALITLGGYLFKVRDWVKKQDAQDDAIVALRKHHEYDMASIKEEQTLLVYGILACLKGLKEQGCNGPVTEAINKIEKHLNKKAHD